MAIAQPQSTDKLSSPDHATLHQIIAADVNASVKAIIVDADDNIGFNTTSFGTNAAKAISIAAGTAPTTSPADVIQMWVADRGGTAGKASLHIRTEDGTQHVLGDRVGIGTTTPSYLFHVNIGTNPMEIKCQQIYVTDPSTGRYITIRQGAGDAEFKSSYGVCYVKSANNNYLNMNYVFYARYNANGGIGTSNPDQRFEIEQTETITGAVTDGYAAALRLDPGYSAASALTVTRHNYMECQDISVGGAGPAAVTDACVLAFDAAAGTHKAIDSGTTKTTPSSVDAWLKINISGTIYYVPAYTSKTA